MRDTEKANWIEWPKGLAAISNAKHVQRFGPHDPIPCILFFECFRSVPRIPGNDAAAVIVGVVMNQIVSS